MVQKLVHQEFHLSPISKKKIQFSVWWPYFRYVGFLKRTIFLYFEIKKTLFWLSSQIRCRFWDFFTMAIFRTLGFEVRSGPGYNRNGHLRKVSETGSFIFRKCISKTNTGRCSFPTWTEIFCKCSTHTWSHS